jgi:muramoyltetrapeptide carboxypeptidase LdcA involved in peptidoglycan recycling
MIKPPRLRIGDTVAIVSPSWGGAGAFPHRIEQAVKHLNSLGFNVKIASHTLNQSGFVSDSPENRVQDIHDMFIDSEVRAIISAIGGNHSCHLLPLLDFDLIRDHPTVFVGFSDITVLNVAIWKKTGLVTFNGPAILTDFGEFPKMFEYTEHYFLKAVTQPSPIGAIEPSDWWTEEFQEWGRKQDLERPRTRVPTQGWTWLRDGVAENTLIGGCLESLEHLRGTPFWPDWEDAILFLETSEGKPSPERIDSFLMDYENMGVLGKLRGMLVGRPMKYSEPEKEQLRDIILNRTRRHLFPIITDMDFGHTAPQFTIPIGCRGRIDSEQRRFEIIDSAVD